MDTFPAPNKQTLLTTYSRSFFFFFNLRKVGHAYDEDFHTSLPMTKLPSVIQYSVLGISVKL